MKYSEDIKAEIGGKFINGDYTNNYKLLHKDLTRLTKSAISEQLTLTDVGYCVCEKPQANKRELGALPNTFCEKCYKEL